jgi:hypothetical protein
MKKLCGFVLVITLTLCLFLPFAPNVHAEESVDYDALFERALTESNEQIANDLVDAFFANLRTFLEELAFRDAKTKQAVIDLFVSDYITSEQLPKIVSHFSTYQVKLPTQTERDSLQALKSAVVYKRYSLPGEHREFAVLFKEAMTANEAESFGVDRDFARAAIDAPSQMLHLLAKEDAQVQERMLVALWSQYYTLLGTILKEKLMALPDTFKLMIYGTEDEDSVEVIPMLREMKCNNFELKLVDGADHSFTGMVEEFIALSDYL